MPCHAVPGPKCRCDKIGGYPRAVAIWQRCARRRKQRDRGTVVVQSERYRLGDTDVTIDV